jgi:hypothetical protein
MQRPPSVAPMPSRALSQPEPRYYQRADYFVQRQEAQYAEDMRLVHEILSMPSARVPKPASVVPEPGVPAHEMQQPTAATKPDVYSVPRAPLVPSHTDPLPTDPLKSTQHPAGMIGSDPIRSADSPSTGKISELSPKPPQPQPHTPGPRGNAHMSAEWDNAQTRGHTVAPRQLPAGIGARGEAPYIGHAGQHQPAQPQLQRIPAGAQAVHAALHTPQHMFAMAQGQPSQPMQQVPLALLQPRAPPPVPPRPRPAPRPNVRAHTGHMCAHFWLVALPCSSHLAWLEKKSALRSRRFR